MGPVIEVTGNGVGTDGEQMRLHPVAGLERARASGVEVAPGWRLARAGDLAGQGRAHSATVIRGRGWPR